MLTELKKEFVRRVCEESIPRILQCLSMLEEEQVWYRQNEHVNSVGNLVLHLNGNGRQWILSGLGGIPDNRLRYAEFIPDQDVSKNELVTILEKLDKDLRPVIDSLSDATLSAIHQVQVFEESGLSILIHVIEHFSYHTGQITLLTKQMTNKPTNYYGDLQLETHE
jgi:uncharacterized damage-inducible protein DinB